MEGRYRFLKNRLNIEMIVSDVKMEDVLIMVNSKRVVFLFTFNYFFILKLKLT